MILKIFFSQFTFFNKYIPLAKSTEDNDEDKPIAK